MIERAALAAMAIFSLAACSGPTPSGGAAQDKFAGLDGEISAWREDILKARADCAAAPKDKACRAFEVACKGEREIAAGESGVDAKVVSAMTFEAWDPARSEYHPASAFAEFVKTGQGWTRQDTPPVNLSTCASL